VLTRVAPLRRCEPFAMGCNASGVGGKSKRPVQTQPPTRRFRARTDHLATFLTPKEFQPSEGFVMHRRYYAGACLRSFTPKALSPLAKGCLFERATLVEDRQTPLPRRGCIRTQL